MRVSDSCLEGYWTLAYDSNEEYPITTDLSNCSLNDTVGGKVGVVSFSHSIKTNNLLLIMYLEYINILGYIQIRYVLLVKSVQLT